MINKILNDYKEIFSFRKNYLKFFRKRSNILSVFIVALSSAVIIACSYIFKISWPLMFIGGTPLFIFPIIKKEISRVDKEIYNCKNRFEANKLFKQNFDLKLKQRYIDVHNVEQVDYFICLVEQNLVELKPGLYIKSGILAGILGPLWLCYLDTAFKFTGNIDEATIFFILIITLFIMFFSLYQILIHGIVDDILYSDYNNLKKLRNLLKDYRLINMNKKFPDIA